jgi:hypothetical protein
VAISAHPGLPGTSSPRPRANRAGIAIAGFVCGLVSFLVSLAFSVNYVVLVYQIENYGQEVGLPRVETQLWGGIFPVVVVALQLATVPVGLVGVVLGVLGWRSLSRRWLARTGVLLSILALVPAAVLITAFIVIIHDCSLNSCF